MSFRGPGARGGAPGLLFSIVLTLAAASPDVIAATTSAARSEPGAHATAKRSNPRAKRASARTHTSPARGTAGMRIAIDPETGKPAAPTLEQRRAFAEQATPAAPSSERLEVIQLADGARLVRLGERGLMYSVARRDAQGRIQVSCLHSKEELRRYAQPGSAPTSPVERAEK